MAASSTRCASNCRAAAAGRSAAGKLRSGTRTARRHHGAQARARGLERAGDQVISLFIPPLQGEGGERNEPGGVTSTRAPPGRSQVLASALPEDGEGLRRKPYAACASLPLKVRPCLPAETVTFSPSLIEPARIISASGSCTDFWITRFKGRAP